MGGQHSRHGDAPAAPVSAPAAGDQLVAAQAEQEANKLAGSKGAAGATGDNSGQDKYQRKPELPFSPSVFFSRIDAVGGVDMHGLEGWRYRAPGAPMGAAWGRCRGRAWRSRPGGRDTRGHSA